MNRGTPADQRALIFRRASDDGRGCHWAPDSQKGPGGHRGPVFLVGPDGQRALTARRAFMSVSAQIS